MHFYLKHIEPNLRKIQLNAYKDLSPSQIPGWDTIMGLQIENLLLNNRSELIKAIGVNPHDIVCENPYIQKGRGESKGCQIDYLIQLRSKMLYFF